MQRSRIHASVVLACLVPALALAQQANPDPAQPAPAPTPAAAPEPAPPASNPAAQTKTLQAVEVTGSRIPRTQIEGPSPVVTITSQDIAKQGFTNATDLMSSLNQNLGQVVNNQQGDSFTAGAQAVDLRGLGPNHTLVLVNGRRIADYPQAYNGTSNFTDISAIPVSLIDRVEILTGSASSVYGSDAIAGVINFILKQKVSDTTFEYRVGSPQRSGGKSQQVDITTGFSTGKVDGVFGLELLDQGIVYAFNRSVTPDMLLSNPALLPLVPPNWTFLRMDANGNYIDPGAARCNALGHLDNNGVFYASQPGFGQDGVSPGFYCGTYRDFDYASLLNGKKMANLFASTTYHFNSYTDFYLDVLANTQHQQSYEFPQMWGNCVTENNMCLDTPFFNTATGQVEDWMRSYFTIDEAGPFGDGFIRNILNMYSLNVGAKGTLGNDSNWNYEANFRHSQNKLEAKWPALLAAKAQALYLGPSLGIDPDSGLDMFYAPVDRLYTPLTQAQFRSITQDSIDNDQARAEDWSMTLTNTSLFNLPAGPVGVAAVAEYGNQYFGTHADANALQGNYYALTDSAATGSRSHSGIGYEFSVPVLRTLNLTTSGRYDRYQSADTTSSKFTYALGFEYRPFQSLLLRGSYSTGFRAPDLTDVFAGPSGFFSDGPDYYRCRLQQPGSVANIVTDCTLGDVQYQGRTVGNPHLQDETSKSFTYGFVYAPSHDFSVTADYYRVNLKNEVVYQDANTILREEADCRLGSTIDGAPVDGGSPFCQQILSQVARNPASATFRPLALLSVTTIPINAATDETAGVDLTVNYRLRTARAGTFDVNFGATYVAMHKTNHGLGEATQNQLSDLVDYQIPRTKANASVTWNFHDFTATLYGTRLGGIPSFDGTHRMRPTFLYNLTLGYKVAPTVDVSLVVDNLFDSMPPRDDSDVSWPFYNPQWFNMYGRSYFADITVHFAHR